MVIFYPVVDIAGARGSVFEVYSGKVSVSTFIAPYFVSLLLLIGGIMENKKSMDEGETFKTLNGIYIHR